MSAAQQPTAAEEIDISEVEEIIAEDLDADEPMDSDSDEGADHDHNGDDDDDEDMMDEDTHIEIQNDSKAYFDGHTSSIFSISEHPTNPDLFITGGCDDVAYVWTSAPASAEDAAVVPRECRMVRKLEAHKDSVIASVFVAPVGAYAVTAGLDGQLQLFSEAKGWKRVDSAQEVEEIVWLAAHPSEPVVAVDGHAPRAVHRALADDRRGADRGAGDRLSTAAGPPGDDFLFEQRQYRSALRRIPHVPAGGGGVSAGHWLQGRSTGAGHALAGDLQPVAELHLQDRHSRHAAVCRGDRALVA